MDRVSLNDPKDYRYGIAQAVNKSKYPPDDRRNFYECTFFVNRPEAPDPLRRNYPKIIELADDVCRAELDAAAAFYTSDSAQMAVRDLDFTKWNSYLRIHCFFDPNIHSLQFIQPDGTFRVIKNEHKFWPVGWVEKGTGSGSVSVQNPAVNWWAGAKTNKRERSTSPARGKAKRARSSSPDHGNLDGWGNTSKRVRIEKYDKPDDDDEEQFNNVDENDPTGDDDGNNSESSGFDSEDLEIYGDDDEDDFQKRVLQQEMDRLARGCEQFDKDTWRDCCEIFGMDHRNESPEQTANISLGGGKTASFKVYQAYGIYLMMLKSRGLAGGGFLSDEQGLGKTRQGLGFCVMEHILSEAWREVAEDREHGGTKHNSLAKQDNQSCPSEAASNPQFAIPCPCSNRSVTFELMPKEGPSLIICPPNLISTWSEEFGKLTGKTVDNGVTAIPRPDEFNMEVVLLHRDHKLSDATRNRVSLWLRDENGKRRPTAELTKYIAISSEKSFNTQAGLLWGLDYIKDNKYPNVGNLRWGRALKDEHHLAHNMGTNAVDMLLELRGDPHSWFLSGTPFEGTPKNIKGYIDILRNRCTVVPKVRNETKWENTAFYHAQENDFDWIIKIFNAEVKAPRGRYRKSMIQNFSTVLKALMIKRTVNSKWINGEKMVKLKPNHHHPEIVQPNPQSQYARDLDKLRAKTSAVVGKKSKKGGKVSGVAAMNASRMLRLCATFPALASIVRTPSLENWTLTQDGIKPEWYTNATGSPYHTHLDEMVQSSEKMTILAGLLDKVQRGRDYKNRPEKVIILSSFPGVMFAIDLWIKRNRNERAILIHGKTDEKNALIEGFQEYDRSAFIKYGNARQRKRYNEGQQATVLLSTLALIGVGYTITRSFRVILMEPAYMKRDEAQGFARVRRIGQENKCTHTHRLENHGSDAELLLIKRQKNRAALSTAAFKRSTDPADFENGAYDPADDNTDADGYTQSNRDRQNALQAARYERDSPFAYVCDTYEYYEDEV